jgi:hypothetical protein
MYNNYGGQQLPKMTKQNVEEYIALCMRVPSSRIKFVRLREAPTVWKHACVSTGVVALEQQRIYYASVPVDYALCRACGKVVYYYDQEVR